MAADDGDSPPEKAGKTRLVTLEHLDRRTKAAQVALSTKDSITADLGGADQLSTLELLTVEHVAVSAAILRDAHVRWLNGEQVPMTEIATMSNTFNRTAQALGLPRRAKDITPTAIRDALTATVEKEDAEDV